MTPPRRSDRNLTLARARLLLAWVLDGNDIETTGFGPLADLRQPAMANRAGGGLVRRLVPSGRPIPADANSIHDITSADA